jgi:hypothetical protein
MSSKKLDIVAIKTNDGKYYITERKVVSNRWEHSALPGFLINGEEPLPTFEKDWVLVSGKPKKITKMEKQPRINIRYELLDKELSSEKLPEFIPRDEVATLDNDYDWVWNEAMRQYRSLYKLVWDEQPDKEQEYEFDLEICLTIPKVVDPVKMEYKIQKTAYETDGYLQISEKDVRYQLADKVILPSILLPQRPCKLTSEQSFKIVRQYIKDHIDPKVAKITSDYDFCFTVKRRIKLAEVQKYTVDVNFNPFSKRKRKPKYVEKQQVEREEECFEMTYSPKNYSGYTPIKGFEGNNQAELKEKIDAYCKKVVAFINTPLIECKHCSGRGIIIPKKEEV